MKKWGRVEEYSVLRASTKGVVFMGTEPITETELKSLKEDVKTLKSLRLWPILHETLRQKAIEKGLVDSKTWEETLSAKMMLHNLGIITSILGVIERTEIRNPLQPPRIKPMHPKRLL